MAEEMAIPFLGKLPLDPRIGNLFDLRFLFSFDSVVEDIGPQILND